MRYWIFYYLTVFSKKAVIFWENGKKSQKIISGGQVSFEGEGTSGDENEYNLFYGKWGFEYLSFNNFSEKKNVLKKKSLPTIQICRLENVEHKKVSYSGKYSLSTSRVPQSHLQFSFVVGNAFCLCFLHV